MLQHIYVIRALTLLVLQRDDQYSAVMDALNKVVETNKKELLETERKASENSRKLQKEINSFTNQVRDLEYQLIMAASEGTISHISLCLLQIDRPAHQRRLRIMEVVKC